MLPCLLVGVGSERYAIPMHSVAVSQAASTDDDSPRRRATDGLGRAAPPSRYPILARRSGDRRRRRSGDGARSSCSAGVTRKHAFRVDTLVGQRDVVVKGMGRLLPRLDILAGASVEPDGSILLVLDAPGLIDRARLARATARARSVDRPDGTVRATQAGCSSSTTRSTIRELERSILERAGYEVRTAADGVEALAGLVETPCDLVLTDVEMPRMDGFALTEAIRANAALTNLPGADPHLPGER